MNKMFFKLFLYIYVCISKSTNDSDEMVFFYLQKYFLRLISIFIFFNTLMIKVLNFRLKKKSEKPYYL